MHIPAQRERVTIVGRNGIFLVVWVDHEEERADVVSLSRVSAVTENVPFSEIHPWDESQAEVRSN